MTLCDGPGLPLTWGALLTHPLALLGPAVWVLLVWTLPRDRVALGVLALSVAARAWAFTPRIHYHLDRAYAELVTATGAMSPDIAYGEGFTALMFWPYQLSGGHADTVHVAHAALSSLAAVHLLAALRGLGQPDRGPAPGPPGGRTERAAQIAAVLLALNPLSVAMAPSETRYVALATLQAAALHGLVRRDRAGDALLVLAGGLLAHLRPFEGALTAAFALAAWRADRRPAAAALAAFCALRLATWGAQPPGVGGAAGEGWTAFFDRPWLGPDARVVAFDPTRTPWMLPVLAALGARRAAPAVTALFVVTCLAYFHQPFLADRLRFAVPAQVWLCALAGVGASALSPRALAAAAVLTAASAWPARHPLPTFPWQAEYTALRAALAQLPPDAIVAYDDRLDRDYQRRWLEACGQPRWVPLGTPGAGWRWVGLTDHAVGDPAATGAPALAVDVDTGPDPMWGCRDCPRQTVTLGLYPLP